jgi:hypothetical protein
MFLRNEPNLLSSSDHAHPRATQSEEAAAGVELIDQDGGDRLGAVAAMVPDPLQVVHALCPREPLKSLQRASTIGFMRNEN